MSQTLADLLASVGDPIKPQEHIDVIFEDLPLEYDSVILVIESKFNPLLIEEVEALLLPHHLNKYHKKLVSKSTTNNLTEAVNTSSLSPSQSNSSILLNFMDLRVLRLILLAMDFMVQDMEVFAVPAMVVVANIPISNAKSASSKIQPIYSRYLRYLRGG